MRCECGGELRAARLEDYDFTPLAGIPCRLVNAPGLRCARCGWETVTGGVINRVLDGLVVEVAQLPARLTPDLARFLRKRMRLTQQELANRMAIGRETVAKWECGMVEISSALDGNLRMIALSHLLDREKDPSSVKRVVAAMRALDHVRTNPPAMPPPIVIDAALHRLRRRAADSSDPTD